MAECPQTRLQLLIIMLAAIDWHVACDYSEGTLDFNSSGPDTVVGSLIGNAVGQTSLRIIAAISSTPFLGC